MSRTPRVDWEEGGVRVSELPASHALLRGELTSPLSVPVSIFRGTVPKSRRHPELTFYLWIAHPEPPSFQEEEDCNSDSLTAELLVGGTTDGVGAPWGTQDVEYWLCSEADGSTTLRFRGDPDRDVKKWGKMRLQKTSVTRRESLTYAPLIPPSFTPRLIPWKKYIEMRDRVGQYPGPKGYIYQERPKWWLTLLGSSLFAAGYIVPIVSDAASGGIPKERHAVYIPVAGAFIRWGQELSSQCEFCRSGPSGLPATFLYFFPGLVQVAGLTLTAVGLFDRDGYWVLKRSPRSTLSLQPLPTRGIGSGISAQLQF